MPAPSTEPALRIHRRVPHLERQLKVCTTHHAHTETRTTKPDFSEAKARVPSCQSAVVWRQWPGSPLLIRPSNFVLRVSTVLLLFLFFSLPLTPTLAQQQQQPDRTQPPPAGAAEAPAAASYHPVGTPANPAVDARWNRFHGYDQATDLLHRIAEAHPDLCDLRSLGQSHGGRELWLLTVTDSTTDAPADAKPAMWIDGGIHANELQSVDVVLYTAWWLTEMFEENDRVRRLLRDRTFYLMPMMSPDSRHAHMTEPNTTHSPRSGQKPVDDDRDGLLDEDGYDDLNGDGHITQMRVPDPHGDWKPHDEDPRIMVRVTEDDENDNPAPGTDPGPRYRLLGFEGFDNDGDGRVNEDGDGYYDPNRNWPWRWQPRYIQRGAGRYPFSVREVRIAGQFIMSRPNIAAAQSYHNTGGMILRGPGLQSDEYHRDDAAIFESIGDVGETILPGYRSLVMAEDLYEGRGVELDWFYAMRGVVAYTNELFTPYLYFHRQDDQRRIFAPDPQHARFDRLLLLANGFIDWQEHEHPDYGTVQIGGFKKSWRRQPPGFMIEQEAHRNMAFTLYHARRMPSVRIAAVDVEPVDADLTAITATIENTELIPTRLRVDLERDITPPDRATLDAPNATIVAALRDGEPLFRSPTTSKHQVETVTIPRVPGHDAVYVRWLVTGPGPFTINYHSHKAGSDSRTIAADD